MVQYFPEVTGSLTINGSLSVSGPMSITGSIAGTSSLASNALLLSGTGSVGFATTGSFTATSSSLSSRTTQIESVYATTGSNSFRATQSITGSLTVTGQIIAQTLNVQQVTSSIIYSSGSNNFGCDLNSRQTFTGSVLMTGSLIVNTTGPELQVNNNGVILGNLLTDNHSITGSLRITGSTTVFAGSIGINGSPGTTFPLEAYINSSTTYTSTSRGNVLRVYNSNATANVYAGIELGGAGVSNDGLAGINGIVTAAGSGDLAFYTRNSNTFGEKMRITSTGNVGFGTCNPLPYGRFAVAGAITVGSLVGVIAGFSDDVNGTIRLYVQSGINGINVDQAFAITTGGTSSCIERMRITSGGNVVINSTVANYKFQVNSGISTSTATVMTLQQATNGAVKDAAGFGLAINNGGEATNAADLIISTASGGSLGERMRISSNGVATFTSSTTGLDNITIKNSSGKTNVIIGSAGGTALFGGMQMFDNTSTAAVYLITDTSANSYMFSGLSIGANLASYKLQLSTDSAGKPNGGSWANSSDIRLKENIHTINNALDKITQLRGVTFDWKDETEQDNIKSSAGFIADEVMLAFPNWVKEVNSSDKQKEIVNDNKIKSLSLPFEFDALLVEAIKELSAKVTALETK